MILLNSLWIYALARNWAYYGYELTTNTLWIFVATLATAAILDAKLVGKKYFQYVCKSTTDDTFSDDHFIKYEEVANPEAQYLAPVGQINYQAAPYPVQPGQPIYAQPGQPIYGQPVQQNMMNPQMMGQVNMMGQPGQIHVQPGQMQVHPGQMQVQPGQMQVKPGNQIYAQ